MKYLTLAAAVGTCLILSACTTSEKVNVMQPGDRALTCTQLKSEFERLDAVKRDAEHDGGLNTANVAAVIFFWPAAAGNYLNARDAEKLVEQRRSHLMTIYTEKQCDNPVNADLIVRVPTALLSSTAHGF